MVTSSLSYGILMVNYKTLSDTWWMSKYTFLQLLYAVGARVMLDGAVEIGKGLVQGFSEGNGINTSGAFSMKLRARSADA